MWKRILAGFCRPDTCKISARKQFVRQVADFEPALEILTDEALREKTHELRSRLAVYRSSQVEIKAEAFAVVREAARRVLGLTLHDVQIEAGYVMSSGNVAEMLTGEGKSLAASLPSYFFGLHGRGVHVVTVNDYLAARDAEEIGRVHEFLGMSVGLVTSGMDDSERRQAYSCDITYVTHAEAGFDYLRDNLKFERDDQIGRGHAFAIIDEADSILIDDARTPLVISAATGNAPRSVTHVVDAVRSLMPREHVEIDATHRTAVLTDSGLSRLQGILAATGEPDTTMDFKETSRSLIRDVEAALMACHVLKRDVDYVVRGAEVLLIDPHTGRSMPGRRYSDGIHEALEAKEGICQAEETAPVATISYQSYFRLYETICGMTGTARAVSGELLDAYGIGVVAIPTHRPVIRVDEPDEIHQTSVSKYAAVMAAVREAHRRGQPILLGTASIAGSEHLERLMLEDGFRRSVVRGQNTFCVLNAKDPSAEAEIVATAGQPFAITIATNMAGRGTDIRLGGYLSREGEISGGDRTTASDAVKAAGGLFVIGTERHESRRIDDQLRGRAGRQGDPGRSKFYVSLEDSLVAAFPHTRTNPCRDVVIRRAQEMAEALSADQRRNMLKYEHTINEQRKAFYCFRDRWLSSQDIDEELSCLVGQAVNLMVGRRIPGDSYPELWDIEGLSADVMSATGHDPDLFSWVQEDDVTEDEIADRLIAVADARCRSNLTNYGGDTQKVARSVVLQSLDAVWADHLQDIEILKTSVPMRSIGQRDPVVEFRTDAFDLFEQMLDRHALKALSMICALPSWQSGKLAA